MVLNMQYTAIQISALSKVLDNWSENWKQSITSREANKSEPKIWQGIFFDVLQPSNGAP